ncbi:PadR family transcriptional regulator [Mucisphaera sp.]|uniref:PadR family transcriptional regulator n=1 Tax=Mucisphaera sp. TaxID=2913024 RepID=UPI003D0E7812
MAVSKELIKGTVVPIVLSLLKEQPRYGYEIVKVVNARTNGRFEWKEGTLYPTLHRLESEGKIKARWQESDTGKRRKYYALTRRGVAELTQRQEEWRSFSAAVNHFLIGA